MTKEYGFVYEIVSWRTQGTMFALKYILEEVVNIWKYVLWDKIFFPLGGGGMKTALWGTNCPLGEELCPLGDELLSGGLSKDECPDPTKIE